MSCSVGSGEMQAGVTVGSGVSVDSIFGVEVVVGDGEGVSVGGMVAAFPQDESRLAATRNKNNCCFMLSRLYREFDTDEYSTTK